jgi:hypothetical protein
MNQTPITVISFSGFYFSYTYPPLPLRPNPHVQPLYWACFVNGWNIDNFQSAMKEIVQRVAAAEKSDKVKYSGFKLNYCVGESSKRAKYIYFANRLSDVLSRRAALNLMARCQNFPFNNWMSSYVHEQGKFVEMHLEQAPADTPAFIRVKGLHHHLFPIRPEDSVVDKKSGRFYYPKFTRRGLTEAKK